MAVDIKVISININGVDTWFEYGDILQELADKVDAFRRNYRDALLPEQRDKFRDYSERIRDNATQIATIGAIELLTQLEQQLTQLKNLTKTIDELINDITNMQEVILGLAEVVNLTLNILRIR